MTLLRLLQAMVLSAAMSLHAYAQVIEVKQFALEATEEGHVLNADFQLELTPRLEDALNNGVALIFAIDFELVRPRWYWFDEKTASARIDVRLSYNPLLRQYRLSTGSLHRNFSSFVDAMNTLTRIRSWMVLEHDRVQPDASYIAAVRMRLDSTQLPRPFQLSAITDRDLSLVSSWKRMPFSIESEHSPR
jgi:hypothetical protein